MRDDLLDAHACLAWVDTQLPRLQDKVEAWWQSGPYRFTEEPHPEAGYQVIKLANIKPIPIVVPVEVGLIIHCLRSALDILMVALAERNGHSSPTDVYFPVARSAQEFLNPKNGAIKKIKRLSTVDQDIIKKLQPYDGGDDLIFALHQLDLIRKHRQLIDVVPTPSVIITTPHALRQGFRMVPVWNGFKNDATVATTMIGATNYEPQITLHIAFQRSGLRAVEGRFVPLVLADFYGKVSDIIKLFDRP